MLAPHHDLSINPREQRTDLISGLVQIVLKITNRRGSAQRYASGGLIDAVGFQLAQINRQALFQAAQGGGVSVAPSRSEKRDIVASSQFDLRIADVSHRYLDIRSHVENRAPLWQRPPPLPGLWRQSTLEAHTCSTARSR